MTSWASHTCGLTLCILRLGFAEDTQTTRARSISIAERFKQSHGSIVAPKANRTIWLLILEKGALIFRLWLPNLAGKSFDWVGRSASDAIIADS